MPITLIIEDGTVGGVANANCYIDETYLDVYATDRGLTINADVEIQKAQIIKATDYLEAFRRRYQGTKTAPLTQVLQFPRTDVVFDSTVVLDENDIPTVLKNAQAQLVVEQEAGVKLFPDPIDETTILGPLKKRAIGPLIREWHNPLPGSPGTEINSRKPIPIASVLSLLEPLFKQGSFLTAVRV